MTQDTTRVRRRNPVRGRRQRSTPDGSPSLREAEGCAEPIVDFANRELAIYPKATPQEVVSELLYGARLRTGSAAKASPATLRALQAEVRAALALVTSDAGIDLRPLLEEINDAGRYSYRLSGPNPTAPVTAGTPIRWYPAYPLKPRAIVMWSLGNALQVADRIGRCERFSCGRYFLRRKRRDQRFCGARCSTAFHNERRQKAGYFKERRRRRRDPGR